MWWHSRFSATFGKKAGASVQSTTGSRGVRISGSNAGYTMFPGSVKSTGYPLHSPISLHVPPLHRRMSSHFNWSLQQNVISHEVLARQWYRCENHWGSFLKTVTTNSDCFCIQHNCVLCLMEWHLSLLSKSEGKVHPCTGAEALYRLYGP